MDVFDAEALNKKREQLFSQEGGDRPVVLDSIDEKD